MNTSRFMACAAAMLVVVIGFGPTPGRSVLHPVQPPGSFSLDDNPSAPIASPIGALPGIGAEDEFGLTFVAGNPGLAPSPSVPAALAVSGFVGDGTMFSGSIGGLQFAPGAGYIDGFSANHRPRVDPIKLEFSVDRLTNGIGAVGREFLGNQAPGDIFRSTRSFPGPANFVGAPGVAPYGGLLPSAGGGGSNTLVIDESVFGLTVTGTPGATSPPGVFVPPPTIGSHDNVDAYDKSQAAPVPGGPPGTGVYARSTFFSVNPDEAATVGVSPADIFSVPAGSTGPATLFAPDAALGLTPDNSIDALVLFDAGTPGSLDPLVDHALFSLAPGSAFPVTFGLSGNEVFFTDFSGKFFTYALPPDVGLFPQPTAPPFNGDNIDALEIHIIPEPITLFGGLMAIGALAIPSRSRRRCSAGDR